MHPMLNIAIQAVRQAGKFIAKQYMLLNNRKNNTQYTNNLLKKINNTTNELIINIIRKYYPSHRIIVKYDNKYITNKINHETQWIINALDSYTNFIKCFPYFAISIAAQIKDNTEISVIYDPIRNDLFSASKGQGAQLNGYRIRMNTHNNSSNTIIITYVPNHKENQDTKIIFLNKIYHLMQKKCFNFHISEAISLDLAYVAIGRIDGVFTTNFKTYNNLISGALLIQESGGLISNFKKNNNKELIYKNIIVAGNPKFIKFILSKI